VPIFRKMTVFQRLGAELTKDFRLQSIVLLYHKCEENCIIHRKSLAYYSFLWYNDCNFIWVDGGRMDKTIKIAVVDDENIICAQIEQYLLRIAKELNIHFEIDVFYSGRELCKHLKQSVCFDVIFLDIEMDDISGITASEFIRKQLVDDGVQIVYVSGKTQYALELFQYSPLDFLVKPVEYGKLKEVIIKISRVMGLWIDVFSYKKNHDTVKVKLKDILYFESEGRKIKVVTTNGTDEFYAIMEDLTSQLERFDFLSIHRSFLVNYHQVKVFRYDEVEMTNNTVLRIGRSKRKEIQDFQLKMEGGDVYDC